MSKKHKHKEASKKPTKKAAGAVTPVAPTSVVAHAQEKAKEHTPTPVTTLPQPVEVPVILPNSDPPAKVEPVIPTKAAKGLSPLEEIAKLQKRIAEDQARLWELEHPIIEFPKMVKGRTFNSREEQDAAGKDYADKK